MQILFIGGTGRLSKDVAKLAADQGNEVYLLTRGSTSRSMFVDSRYHMLFGDIKDTIKVKEILNDYNFDVVIDFLTYDCKQLYQTLDAIEGKYKQYIFVSSATVYKRDNYDELISEYKTAVGNDKWEYAKKKAQCESEVKNFFQGRTEYYTIIRPGVTYGNTRIPYPIVPPNTQKEYSFLYRIKIGDPIPEFDNGRTEVTVTNTKDFAKGVIGLMGNKQAYNEAFHITSDEKVTWGSVLDCLESIMHTKINRMGLTQAEIYDAIPYYKEVLIGDKGNKTRYDNSKILSVVPGLSFEIPLKTGLEETIRFYDNNKNQQLIDYYWMGCIDRLAKMNHYPIVKLTFDKRMDHFNYLRGRFKILDIIYKSVVRVFRVVNKSAKKFKI
nr:NAD-dependent epimerase/dehydratase family protein [Clostridia bacterium]